MLVECRRASTTTCRQGAELGEVRHEAPPHVHVHVQRPRTVRRTVGWW
jgi:hypothetical protein